VEEEHTKHLEKVFTTLDAYSIQLNPAECIFGAIQVIPGILGVSRRDPSIARKSASHTRFQEI